MIWVFLLLMFAAMVVFAAGRIILGWILPKATMARIDRGFNRARKLCFQVTVVMLGAGIVFLVWSAVAHR